MVKMPDVTKTEIGRRMYQLHKEKGVEKIIEKMRRNIGPEWKAFTGDEIHLLERLLSAAWANIEQSKWDQIQFSRMSKDDVRRVLDVGKYTDLDKTPQHAVVGEIENVLLSVK